jgi:nucleotide-binding universal stress UspA family protein
MACRDPGFVRQTGPDLPIYCLFTGNGLSWGLSRINLMVTKQCRLEAGDKEVSATMFTRILLAIDDSASSDATVSFAAAMARQSSASVRVVHVNELLVGGRGLTQKTQAQAMQHLENAVTSLRGADISTEGALYVASCFGISERIADSAHDWLADVIVLGSRRNRRFSRFVGKGIRDRVTVLTPLPVLTAPAPLKVATKMLPELSEMAPAPPTPFPALPI